MLSTMWMTTQPGESNIRYTITTRTSSERVCAIVQRIQNYVDISVDNICLDTCSNMR
jgi:hypothetical protein